MSQALADNLVEFGRLLRRSGLPVIPEQTRLFAATLERIGVATRRDVKAAGRVIYTRRREEIAVYDAAFDLFWRRSMVEGGPSEQLPTLSRTLQSSARSEGSEGIEGAALREGTLVRPREPSVTSSTGGRVSTFRSVTGQAGSRRGPSPTTATR